LVKVLKIYVYALYKIVETYRDVEIIYPVHLNPNVQEPVRRILEGVKRIHLIEPVGYLELLKLMQISDFILTDSGGIQEEAPTFKKPVLVLREFTERPEGIEIGIAKLVGIDINKILSEVGKIIKDGQMSKTIKTAKNPYGDGKAAKRIVNVIKNFVNN
jgi:UDP-N-acetylglucosamine 2-epimerase (non-hydrolysing)